MRLADFELERYFARWEFEARYLLCASDVQGYPMADLLALADDETRALWADLGSATASPPGHPLLRREIAALYDTIEPDEVLTFAGAEEAIFCLLNVLVGPGDHAIVRGPATRACTRSPGPPAPTSPSTSSARTPAGGSISTCCAAR